MVTKDQSNIINKLGNDNTSNNAATTFTTTMNKEQFQQFLEVYKYKNNKIDYSLSNLCKITKSRNNNHLLFPNLIN
jgi:hypothetical protein